MIQQWQPGIVKRIEQATHNTRSYWIELPETQVFDFKPGQFVTLDLPIHEQRNKRWRSYSIASMPDGGNVIELLIVFVDGGMASNYIFNEVKEGSILTLRGPQGTFVLPETLDKTLYLICTGTGIAPFHSMLQYINYHNLPHQQIHLIFGSRNRKDLLYDDTMRGLEGMMPGLSYHPTLSREEWAGNKGYVHAIYEDLAQQRGPAMFLLCGWRAMIDEARRRIQEMGYDKKDIHLELYG
jgi:ferredoxin-NADP reductase